MTNIQKMINQIADRFSLNDEMKNILSVVDRGLFSPFYSTYLPYTLDAIYIGNGRWMQSPLAVVKVAKYLEVKKSDKILEIGCGSGYQAAILSKMCQKIYTIDCDATLLNQAQKYFEILNIKNVKSILALREQGWEPKETFDRIVFSACVKEVPNIYFDKLAENGMMIVPLEISGEYQVLTRYHKKNGVISEESIEQCSFISMQSIREKCSVKKWEDHIVFYIKDIIKAMIKGE